MSSALNVSKAHIISSRRGSIYCFSFTGFFFQCTYEFILLARSVKSGNVYSSGKDPGYETIPADKISNPVGQEKQIFKSNRSSATSGLVIHIIDSLTISAVLLKLK